MLLSICAALSIGLIIGFFFLRAEMSDDDQDGDETTY